MHKYRKLYCNQGRIQGGGRLGEPPPLDFQSLKRKGTVTHHSNRKRDKEEEGRRKKEEEEYQVSGVMWPPLLPSYVY